VKPHPALLYGAVLIAAVTLVLAGVELAGRFTRQAPLRELVAPAFGAATALICIAVLDWAGNVRRRRRSRREEHEEPLRAAPEPRPIARSGLVQAIHDLDVLANEELGEEKTIQGAVEVVAKFARASSLVFYLRDTDGGARLRADWRDGQATLYENAAPEPEQLEPVLQVIESRQPLLATEAGTSRLLVPVVGAGDCRGALAVTVDEPASEGAAERLAYELGELARHFARAILAPAAYEKAILDPLTGLYTRRHFINRLTEATGLSRRYGEPLSLAIFDVDNFSVVNNTYGAATGDRVLQTVAALIRENIREVDSLFRYGADEFAVILPETDVARARQLADRVRRLIRAERTVAEDGGQVIASVCVGVAEFEEDMRGIGPLIAQAEEALYAAKTGGHDRTVVAGEEPAEETTEA